MNRYRVPKFKFSAFAAITLLVAAGAASNAHGATVTAQVAVVRKSASKVQNGEVVLWLSPLQPEPYSVGHEAKPARLVQKNKSFEPHLLVIRAGSLVEFPNKDPFFHNVFSLFDGKRFDLGLYEAGSMRSVRFERPGISFIFCNIHAQMTAIVVALDTPYYAVSNRGGNLVVPDIPPGRYLLQVWREGSSARVLGAFRRELVVNDGDNSLGVLRIAEDEVPVAHKNKYGRDYEEAQPAASAYPQ